MPIGIVEKTRDKVHARILVAAVESCVETVYTPNGLGAVMVVITIMAAEYSSCGSI